MNAATTSSVHSCVDAASRQRSARRRSMSSSRRSIRVGVCSMRKTVKRASDGTRCGSVAGVATVRFGPGYVPSQTSPEEAVELLLARGYTACEIDFGGGFWADAPFATRLGELARDAGIVLSVHAPLPAFLGHAERGKKLNMAIGMLDHTAGIAKAAGAEVIVLHPGFFLGREREDTIAAVCERSE